MQRFFNAARKDNTKGNAVISHAFKAASKYNRAIGIMYDLSGLKAHGEDCSSLIEDWKFLVDSLKVTNQDGAHTYIFHNGKPLVTIWGVGFPDRPYDIRDIGLKRFIDFLCNDPEYGGCSIMLGVPTYWRELPLLHNDMDRYRDVILRDMSWCKENGIEYVPCVTPGFSWHNLSRYAFPDDVKPSGSIPRQGGRFYWQQISTAINCGARMLYIAMFDEVNEGTAIFKCTDNPPVGKNIQFVGMDNMPSDHYLWLTGEASLILKGKKSLTFTLPKRPH